MCVRVRAVIGPLRGLGSRARADACVCRGGQGVDLGPLQGIPYGLKDLIAVEGYRTTWGAPAYLAQVLPDSAAVYGRCAAPRILAIRKWAPRDRGSVLGALLAVAHAEQGPQRRRARTLVPWVRGGCHRAGAPSGAIGPGARTSRQCKEGVCVPRGRHALGLRRGRRAVW
jgi:hypothetical protein